MPRTENADFAGFMMHGVTGDVDLIVSHGNPGGDDGGVDLRCAVSEKIAADGLEGTVLSDLTRFSILARLLQ